MAERIIRDAEVRVKLHPLVKERLERLSALYGAPPSTICALWIGQKLTHEEKAVNLLDSVGEQMGGSFNDLVRGAMAQFAGVDQGVPVASHDFDADMTVAEFNAAIRP